MMSTTSGPPELEACLAALDDAAVVQSLQRLVQVPSITGNERSVTETFVEIASELGLEAELQEHDPDEMIERFGHPGSIAERDELVGATATLRATGAPTRRLCLNGHLDVVDPGTVPWTRDPWSGAEVDGAVFGRGAVDMKAGVVAALHAQAAVLKALGASGVEVVLQAVPSEEDGGLGTFAALERDAEFDACLIPEPTSLEIVCAHAGALQFVGTVGGRTSHAAFRLEGDSAIDRYVTVHEALRRHEREVNADVEHPLMREIPLPYPLSIGTLQSGRWPSQVPDQLEFAGRTGLRVGEAPEAARAAFEAALSGALGSDEPPVSLRWTSCYRSGATDPDHPFVGLVRSCAAEELSRPVPVTGMPYGADMWQFCDRGIPCVMFGAGNPRLAHAVDEHVPVSEVLQVARTMIRLILHYATDEVEG